MHKIAAALLALAATSLTAQTQAQTLQTIPSMPVAQFQNSLGINLHIEYTDGKYADATQVLEDLQYIGIRNVRDYIPDPVKWAPGAAQHLEQLAAAGIRFDFIGDCNASFSTAMQQLDALAGEYPGVVLSVEGPNEINNFPCYTGSGSNQQQATSYQQQLYSYVHNDSNLKNVPVLYMTGAAPIDLVNTPGLADAANTHPYPYSGDEPWGVLQRDFPVYFPTLPSSVPRQITETGYFTMEATNAVGPIAQGQMLTELYLDSALLGNTRTYDYQLLVPYNNNTSDSNYGIFNYDGSPKLAAEMLHNLHTLVPEDVASSQKVVKATVSGVPSGTGKMLALTASDGSIYLFMWNERPIWNPVTMFRTTFPSIPIQVSMAGNWTVNYISLESSAPSADLEPAGNGSYTVQMEQYPTAIVFHPKK